MFTKIVKILKPSIIFLSFLSILCLTDILHGQGLVRSFLFFNANSENEDVQIKKAKRVLLDATKNTACSGGQLLESVSGKHQYAAVLLWKDQRQYKSWKDSLLNKAMSKESSKQSKKNKILKKIGKRVGEHSISVDIKEQIQSSDAAIKNIRVNDYLSFTLWTINKETEETFFSAMTSLFDKTKKQKGFHYGEYGINGESNNKLICMTYWDSKESCTEYSKQLKLKVKKNENMSLLNKELLEKNPENKRYKVKFVN